MTLHFSQIGFTLGRTFTDFPSSSLICSVVSFVYLFGCFVFLCRFSARYL